MPVDGGPSVCDQSDPFRHQLPLYYTESPVLVAYSMPSSERLGLVRYP